MRNTIARQLLPSLPGQTRTSSIQFFLVPRLNSEGYLGDPAREARVMNYWKVAQMLMRLSSTRSVRARLIKFSLGTPQGQTTSDSTERGRNDLMMNIHLITLGNTEQIALRTAGALQCTPRCA